MNILMNIMRYNLQSPHTIYNLAYQSKRPVCIQFLTSSMRDFLMPTLTLMLMVANLTNTNSAKK